MRSFSEGKKRPQGVGLVSFYGLGNFIKWEDYSNYFGEGAGISRNWATPHFRPIMVSLRTVMVPVGVSLSMLMYYSEHIMRLKVYWKSNLLPSWA